MAQTTGGIEKPTRTRTGGHKAVASTPPDSAAVTVKPSTYERTPVLDEAGDTVKFEPNDSLILAQASFVPDTAAATNLGKLRVFNPDPKRAMWLSALCPGLGQIYNRRYWKIPIVVGAFVGLGYGTAWNNRMLGDYTKAYRDITDNDPNTRSYMNFFPKTVKESDLDKEWLTRALKTSEHTTAAIATFASSAWWLCISSISSTLTSTPHSHTSTFPPTLRWTWPLPLSTRSSLEYRRSDFSVPLLFELKTNDDKV